MFKTLGILRSLKDRVKVPTLDMVFERIDVDERSWDLLSQSQMAQNEITLGVERLQQTIVELVKRLNKKTRGSGVDGQPQCVETIVDKPHFNDEANFAYRVYAWSNTLHEQIFRFLKPQFAEIETYIEERGNIQYIDLKVFYAKLRGQLEFMTHSRAHRASTVSSVPDDYDRNSKTGVRGNDGEEKEIYTEAKTVDGKDSRGGDNNTESGDCTGRETGDSFNGGHTDHDHDNDSEEEYVLSGSEVEEGEREVLREAAQKSRLEQKKMANSKYTSTHDAARGVLKGVRKEERKKHKVALIQSDDRHNSLLNVDTVKTKPRSPSSSPSSPASPSNNKKKLFSDLLSTRGLKQYPLPRNDPPAIIPSLDFLSDYIGHHTKSFSIAESLIDVYFLCLMCQLVTLAVTEMLGKKSLYSKCLTSCNKLSCHFNRLGMPLLERLLRIEQKFFDDNLLVLSMRGIEKGMHYSDARHLIRKTRVFDQIFAALDIFILPTSIPAHTHGCKAISQSHLDPHFVLTGGYDTALRIWDTVHSKCLAQFMGHKSIVTWCSFNQLDNWVVSTSFDGTAKQWNARTAECIRTMEGHEDGVMCGDLGHGDKYLATGSMDCTVRIWSTMTGNCLRVYKGHRHWIKAVKFSPDGTAVLSAGLDKRIYVWNLKTQANTNGAPRHILRAHQDYILDLLVLPNKVLSASKDHTIKVWDYGQKGHLIYDMQTPQEISCLCLAVSLDGRHFAAGFFDNSIMLYDAKNFECLRTLRVTNDGIISLKFINNRALAVGSSDGYLQIIQLF